MMKREHKVIHINFSQLHKNMTMYSNNDPKVFSKIVDYTTLLINHTPIKINLKIFKNA